MIEIRDLTKHYGPNRVLDGVDLDVAAGEVVLLLGDNGAGKSTLLRCVLGVVPYAGRVRVDGRDPLREGRAARQRIGYMPQTDGLHADMTVGETLRFYAALRGTPETAVDMLLAEARLDDAEEARVEEISGGMRQRLAFALALLGDPPILLLDEPTSSLDGWSRDFFVDRVRSLAERGKAILLSTHTEHRLLLESGRAVTLRAGRLARINGNTRQRLTVAGTDRGVG